MPGTIKTLKGLKKSMNLQLIRWGKRQYIKRTRSYTKELICFNFAFNFDHFDNSEYNKKLLRKVNKRFKKILELLKNDKTTRQAFLSLWEPRAEIPQCIVSFHFLIRRGKLITIVYYRSLDLEKVKQDISVPIYLSKKICNELKIKLNYIKFVGGSLHKYVAT